MDVGRLGAECGHILGADGGDHVVGPAAERFEQRPKNGTLAVEQGAERHVHGRPRRQLAHPVGQTVAGDGVEVLSVAYEVSHRDDRGVDGLQCRWAGVEVQVPVEAARVPGVDTVAPSDRRQDLGGETRHRPRTTEDDAVARPRGPGNGGRDGSRKLGFVVQHDAGAPTVDERDEVSEPGRRGDAAQHSGDEGLEPGLTRRHRVLVGESATRLLHLRRHPQARRVRLESGRCHPRAELGRGREHDLMAGALGGAGERNERIEVAVARKARAKDPQGLRSLDPGQMHVDFEM